MTARMKLQRPKSKGWYILCHQQGSSYLTLDPYEWKHEGRVASAGDGGTIQSHERIAATRNRRGFVDDSPLLTVFTGLPKWSEREEWLFFTSIMSFIVLSKELSGKLRIDKIWNFYDCWSGLFERSRTITIDTLISIQVHTVHWVHCSYSTLSTLYKGDSNF